ncbi:STAS domain-containing protein [Streptomyces nanhaiensis]|uniref:STAS domain-containing protein n=1 Tax=Streptomyces nanhaiensis TaxID=679319 RepID=UPI00399C6673
MTAEFTFILQSVRGQLAVADVTGDADYATAPVLRKRGQAAIDSGHPVLVLDLSGVGEVDSSTLGALRHHARAAGGTLALAAVPERLARMLALTGAETVLPVHPTVGEAVTALSASVAGGTGGGDDGPERVGDVGAGRSE